MRALLDRLGSGVQVLPWSAYLPAELLPRESGCGQAVGTGGALVPAAESEVLGKQSPASSRLDCLEIAGRVWSLSQEAHGCRQVQAALDAAGSDGVREAWAGELRGHVLQASKCPHANHVLQKCIGLLRPAAVQFVIDEMLAGAVSQTARHKYGCRILQRLVEHCPAQQVRPLVETLVPEVGMLSRHPYGNYVVQNLLQRATEDQRHRMVGILAKDIRFLGSEACGCAVVSTALSYAPEADRQTLARSLCDEPGLLVFMACTRHGHVAVLRVLELLEGDERHEASRRLQSEAGALRVSRYGCVVVEHVEALEARMLSMACHGGA